MLAAKAFKLLPLSLVAGAEKPDVCPLPNTDFTAPNDGIAGLDVVFTVVVPAPNIGLLDAELANMDEVVVAMGLVAATRENAGGAVVVVGIENPEATVDGVDDIWKPVDAIEVFVAGGIAAAKREGRG